MEVDNESLNESSDSLKTESQKHSKKSHPKSKKNSVEDLVKDVVREPEPKLSEIDFLLTIWQSDCAELKQAGVEIRLQPATIDEKPCILLAMVEIAFCVNCELFHSTKENHVCLRGPRVQLEE